VVDLLAVYYLHHPLFRLKLHLLRHHQNLQLNQVQRVFLHLRHLQK
tara:strand:- start:199 stop:336 length:138 start_codon:yes stop_codon:yes gene_type:complete